jgi:hypothetical protein
MKKFVFVFALTLANWSAQAQNLPAEVLDKEYDNCVNQPGTGSIAQKKAYCLCMRNKMASWTLDTYVNIAKEVEASGARSPTLEALTKDCFNRTAR